MATEQPKKIACSRRKQKGCEEVLDKCTWDGVKCTNKSHSVPVKAPTVKPQVPAVPTTPAVPVKPQVPAVPTAPVKVPTVKPQVPQVPTVKPQTTPIPSQAQLLKEIPHRHCAYYASAPRISAKLTHRAAVDMKGCLKEPYDPKYRATTNVHLGQRKLMLSEIQLLLEYYKTSHEPPMVVYIGSAPGTHLLFLSKMFPDVFFILYDGAVFDQRLKKYPKSFEIHEGPAGFFTTEKCHQLKKRLDAQLRPVIFVSDIRLGENDNAMFEHGVTRDMELQQEWVQILRPRLSLLKFRMSYHMKHGESLKYLKGTILYGVWPKQQSGETRLLVEQKDAGTLIDYDFKEYEEAMFFHNKYTRSYCFPVDDAFKKYMAPPKNIYCPCYDCMSELRILNQYSKLFNAPLDKTIKYFGSAMNPEHQPVFLNTQDAQKVGPFKPIDPEIARVCGN